MSDQLKKDLKAAKKLLKAGWCQRAYMKSISSNGGKTTEQYCIRGAINKAISGEAKGAAINHGLPASVNLEESKRIYNTNKAIENILMPIYPNIVVYNDDEKRTKKEVLAVIDKAIASCG